MIPLFKTKSCRFYVKIQLIFYTVSCLLNTVCFFFRGAVMVNS